MPVVAVHNHVAHPLGQMARHGELGTAPAWDLGFFVGRAGDTGIHAADPFKAPDLAAEQEGVAGGQLLEIPFLRLADLSTAAVTAGRDPDVQGRARHDGSDIEPVALSGLRIAHAPQTVLALHDAAEVIIGSQGIAAVRDEGQDIVEFLPRHVLIGGR